MLYSCVSLGALLTLFIGHFDVVFNRGSASKIPAYKHYRIFILSIACFYLVDVLWGVFDFIQNDTALYVISDIYYLLIAVTVFCWTLYVTKYLEERSSINHVIIILGSAFLLFAIIVLIVNIFNPIFFEINENNFKVHYIRYLFYSVQILMHSLAMGYIFFNAKNKPYELKVRYLCMSAFSFIMMVAIVLQAWFPFYPIYGLGCEVGIVLSKSFVINAEKREAELSLNDANRIVRLQTAALNTAKELAYTDALTGAKSKHAYVELEEEIDLKIREDKINEFALAIFDLNDLKVINDTLGHETGDRYLIESVELIRYYFPDEEIYRFGGDEFVILLEGNEYKKRYELLDKFNAVVKENKTKDKPVIATGVSEFIKGKDNTLRAVFIRADERMYANKRMLKESC